MKKRILLNTYWLRYSCPIHMTCLWKRNTSYQTSLTLVYDFISQSFEYFFYAVIDPTNLIHELFRWWVVFIEALEVFSKDGVVRLLSPSTFSSSCDSTEVEFYARNKSWFFCFLLCDAAKKHFWWYGWNNVYLSYDSKNGKNWFHIAFATKLFNKWN